MIVVDVKSADGLRRKVWEFLVSHQYTPGLSYARRFLTLTRYAEETRPSTRHKFRRVKQWDAMDERSYNSDLKRPAEIPQWVVDRALAQLEGPFVTIGWTREDCVARTVEGDEFCP